MKKLYVLIFGIVLAFGSTLFTAEDESAVEEVVVVGSQIKGAKITGALPVSVVTGIDIEATGVDSGDDLLEHIAEQGQNYFTEAEDASGGKCISRRCGCLQPKKSWCWELSYTAKWKKISQLSWLSNGIDWR